MIIPEKQTTVATYAAGASLAAITLVYVFAPTFFQDQVSTAQSSAQRKRGVVGLSNPANDCFINSVLQSLASLGSLRVYLIREVHRRSLDGPDVYKEAPENHDSHSSPSWKIEGLQQGLVTHGLKEMLDALNERPLEKKTVSAASFIAVMEAAFRQKISHQQQDAQEFLQIVAERLNDEYHAGHMARQRARIKASGVHPDELASSEKRKSPASMLELPTIEHREDSGTAEDPEAPAIVNPDPVVIEEDGFPLEGATEAQVECLTCGFQPKSIETTFCTMTLHIPLSTTTLESCFDGIFKTEHIDDFKCEKCRLEHAVTHFQRELTTCSPEKTSSLESIIERLKAAIEEDPEHPPKDIELPDVKFAPKRKIARHVRMTKFPKILAIHLSRSIFDYGSSSQKNTAKVEFPENLPLGGLLNRRNYKLVSLTTHKGTHQSGHYESFKRQASFPAFSNPNGVNPNGAYQYNVTSSPVLGDDGKGVEVGAPSPELSLSPSPEASLLDSPAANSPKIHAVNGAVKERISTDSHRSMSSNLLRKRFSKISGISSQSHRDSSDREDMAETSSMTSSFRRRLKLGKDKDKSSNATVTNGEAGKRKVKESKEMGRYRRRRKRLNDRWWRISDEKVKESKTSEVLAMQKEVYLLFYEMET